jgi:hypothetical protein
MCSILSSVRVFYIKSITQRVFSLPLVVAVQRMINSMVTQRVFSFPRVQLKIVGHVTISKSQCVSVHVFYTVISACVLYCKRKLYYIACILLSVSSSSSTTKDKLHGRNVLITDSNLSMIQYTFRSDRKLRCVL